MEGIRELEKTHASLSSNEAYLLELEGSQQSDENGHGNGNEKDEEQEMVEMLQAEIGEERKALEETISSLVTRLIPADKDDQAGSILVEIRAGTGGEEASLFAGDLFHMYTMFCQQLSAREGEYTTEVFSISKTSLGGLKYAIFSVTGFFVPFFLFIFIRTQAPSPSRTSSTSQGCIECRECP